jgi:hypothetical protein
MWALQEPTSETSEVGNIDPGWKPVRRPETRQIIWGLGPVDFGHVGGVEMPETRRGMRSSRHASAPSYRALRFRNLVWMSQERRLRGLLRTHFCR